jgi:hypothetical protein
MYDMLKLFEIGRSHMAVLTQLTPAARLNARRAVRRAARREALHQAELAIDIDSYSDDLEYDVRPSFFLPSLLACSLARLLSTATASFFAMGAVRWCVGVGVGRRPSLGIQQISMRSRAGRSWLPPRGGGWRRVAGQPVDPATANATPAVPAVHCSRPMQTAALQRRPPAAAAAVMTRQLPLTLAPLISTPATSRRLG